MNQERRKTGKRAGVTASTAIRPPTLRSSEAIHVEFGFRVRQLHELLEVANKLSAEQKFSEAVEGLDTIAQTAATHSAEMLILAGKSA